MRGFEERKHEKTRKSQENTSGKLSIWNTIEQYAGLKYVAASPFLWKTFSISRKSRNRHFLHFEQYAGLESAKGQQAGLFPGQE